jgi:hypothetical protein
VSKGNEPPGGTLLGFEIVAAVLVDLPQVLWYQREDSALRKMLPVNLAAILPVDFLKERTLQKYLAAGTASGALTSASGKQFFIVFRVDVGADEAPDLPLDLECPDPNFLDRRGRGGRIEDW